MTGEIERWNSYRIDIFSEKIRKLKTNLGFPKIMVKAHKIYFLNCLSILRAK
jgi:hypothetical protein